MAVRDLVLVVLLTIVVSMALVVGAWMYLSAPSEGSTIVKVIN